MDLGLLFLTSETGKQFAILNLSQFCYIDGIEETEEHPDGSKTAIVIAGGYQRILDMPYRDIANQIADAVKKAYTVPAQIRAAESEANRERTAVMMKEVLHDYMHPHE